MAIYIILLFTIFANNVIAKGFYSNRNKRNKCEIILDFVAVFLVCALRSPTVGRDLPGYERIFELTRSIDLSNFDYVYFENGYILWMKLFCSIDASFQVFLAATTLVILVPMFLFICKYSESILVSVMTYVCYMYFEFNLSAIRQSMSMSIFLIGYMMFLKRPKRGLCEWLGLTVVAYFFHKGAFVCFLFMISLLIPTLKRYIIFIVGMFVIGLSMRGYILAYIKILFSKDTMNLNSTIYFGNNMMFLILLACLIVASYYLRTKNNSINRMCGTNLEESQALIDYDRINIEAVLMSVVLAILLGTETSARSYMYINQILIAGIPASFAVFDSRSQKLVPLIYLAFIISMFIFGTLLGSNFDIVPYEFFWK